MSNMDQENRVIVLIDMDCFYCQVEEKLNPELKGKPIAVVQYNPWKGGGIIAVNYVARAMGVNRHMRGNEAKEKCPEIVLPSVPCLRGKADISIYREAGKEVAKVLQRFTPLLERASIDEAYLDITAPVQDRLKTLNVNDVNEDLLPNTFALGYGSMSEFMADVHNITSDSIEFDYEHAKQLLVGAVIVSEIRAAVYQDTGYRCSAGIAHNKILAKLVCGMNKPDKQTVLPKHSINILYSTLSVKKVKHLGGKFGDTVCKILKIKNMSQLQAFTLKELQARFDEKNGTWLYNIARGIDLEPVQAKFNPKSIGCCKQLRGKSALTDLDSLKKWLTDLGDEIEERLEKDALENNRTPKQMVVSFSTSLPDGRDVSSSRSYNFSIDDDLCGELFTIKAMGLVMETTEGLKFQGDESNRKLKAPIKFLGISVGKFEDNTESKKTKKILDYFGAGTSKQITLNHNDNTATNDALVIKKKKQNVDGKEFILQKFLNISNRKQNGEKLSETHTRETSTEVVVEATLEKQESFFAKLLNNKPSIKLEENQQLSETTPDKKEVVKQKSPSTPVCDVLNCGENSNDTEYSSSTIDMEINKSIALFEENPEDIDRVSNMRKLLNSTLKIDKEEDYDTASEKSCTENKSCPDNKISNTNNEDSVELRNIKVNFKFDNVPKSENVVQEDAFQCPDCKKTVSIDELDTHADYHLALKLREEERQQVRLERNERNSSKCVVSNSETKRGKPTPEVLPNKNEISSIASFLVKIDNTIPTETCPECNKRVLKEKLSEHLDFHEARKLSRVLNSKNYSTITPDNKVKRKRTSVSPLKKPKVACKSIDSFFR